jgi:hypothetical protein
MLIYKIVQLRHVLIKYVIIIVLKINFRVDPWQRPGH